MSLSISELADRAGVSIRTVRYYVAEGLLPAPKKSGRYAEYGPEYLDRLTLIGRLKDAFLPLAEIRTRLVGLSDPDVASLLEKESAEDASRLRLATTESGDIDPADDVDFLPGVETAVGVHWRPDEYEGENEPKPRQEPSGSREDTGRYLKDRPGDSETGRKYPLKSAGSSWVHYRLADGLELHVSTSLHPWRERILRRILIELRRHLRDW